MKLLGMPKTAIESYTESQELLLLDVHPFINVNGYLLADKTSACGVHSNGPTSLLARSEHGRVRNVFSVPLSLQERWRKKTALTAVNVYREEGKSITVRGKCCDRRELQILNAGPHELRCRLHQVLHVEHAERRAACPSQRRAPLACLHRSARPSSSARSLPPGARGMARRIFASCERRFHRCDCCGKSSRATATARRT